MQKGSKGFQISLKIKKGGYVKRSKDQSSSGESSIGRNETGERYVVLEALRKNGWNIAKAAKSVRMNHSQFVRLLRKYGFRDVL
jgi:transcriptional regulator with GAF, ATPase, and Fis domain